MISTRIYTTAKKSDGANGSTSRHTSIYATTGTGGYGDRGITDLKNLDYVSSMEGEFGRLNVTELLTAVAAYIQDLSEKNITTEYLEVTKSAHFFELIIDKIKAAGGAVLFTPADGFQVEKVERISGGYRLWWRAQDPLTGKKNVNMWKVNDQAICQNFNEAKQGTSHDVRSKYYWSLVFNVSEAPELTNLSTEADAKMVECNYIDISTATYDGTVDPEVGDEVAMLGHRGEETARQQAIYIAAYKSIDGDIIPPLFATYKGINDFDLSSHKATYIASGVTPAGKAKGLTNAMFIGSFMIKDGEEDIEDWIDELFKDAEEDIENAKKELQDVIDANEEARDQTDKIMQDGLITDDEKTQLKAIRKSLVAEYGEAAAAYAPVYGNTYLKGTAKTNLANAKSAMDTAYAAVIAKIDQLLALTTISKGGAEQVMATFNAFTKALNDYRVALENATNSISQTISDTATSELKTEITEQLNELNEDLGVAQDDINQLATGLAATNQTVSNNQAATTAEFGKVRQEFKAADGELSSEISQASASITKLRTDMNSEIEGLENVDASIRADLTTTNNTVTVQGGKITNLESTTTTLSNTTSTLRQDVNSISNTVTKHTNSINSINGDIETMDGQIGTLQGTVKTHTTQIGSLTTSYNNINATVSSQTTKITNLTTRVGNNETEISSIKTTYAKKSYVDIKADEVEQAVMTEVTEEIDGLETVYAKKSYVDTKADEVSIGVQESIENEIVNNTGINIKTGEINMTANYINCKPSGGSDTVAIQIGDRNSYPHSQLTTRRISLWNANQNQYAILGAGSEGGFMKVGDYYNSTYSEVQAYIDKGQPRLLLRRGGSYGLSMSVNSNNKVIIVPYNGTNGWPIEGVDDISALPAGALYLRDDSCIGVRR